MSRSTSICVAATSTRAFAEADHVFEHSFRTQQVDAHAARAACRDGRCDATARSRSIPRRRPRPSCGSRSRGCSAGRRTACGSGPHFSAAASAPRSTSSSKRWLSALSLLARRPVKVALTMEEQFFTITQARQHVSHQERCDQGRAHHRATLRSLVERRRLCRHRPARRAEIGIHARLVPTTSRMSSIDSYRDLYQPTAGRRVARLRRAADWSGPMRATPI